MRCKLFCYNTGPIDNFYGLHTFESLEEEMGGPCRESVNIRSELDRLLGACLPAFRDLGWEGDCNLGPGFFMLPDPEGATFQWGVAIKQGNNGQSFIASPFPLPYLEEHGRHVEVFAEL